MHLSLIDNLAFTSIRVTYQNEALDIPNVLIDTGSGATILAADIVSSISIGPAPDDILYTIRGVGGSEVVFSRKIDQIQLGECAVVDFEVEIGGMDYGFPINGILGMDLLQKAKAIINLSDMTIQFDK